MATIIPRWPRHTINVKNQSICLKNLKETKETNEQKEQKQEKNETNKKKEDNGSIS